MPELPEVETTLRGIIPHTLGKKITNVIVRQPRLRWPVPANLKKHLQGLTIQAIERRAKYLLFKFNTGTLILHLGMSGRLRVLNQPSAAGKHDHVEIHLTDQIYLRYTDPRRFGAILWTNEDIAQHVLLANIGPEPFASTFTGAYLFAHAKGKKIPVKAYVMDSKVVAGVGNIYATEALFNACIHPHAPAGKVTLAQYQQLAKAIRAILKKAIAKGGTTLKDFLTSDGTPGYFSMELQAYGREGKPCPRCHTALKSTRIGQRASVYCDRCQKI